MDSKTGQKINLTLNSTKTKLMLLSTSHLSSFHSLDKAEAVINANGKTLERVSSIKLLSTHIQQHSKWEDNVKAVALSCYAT